MSESIDLKKATRLAARKIAVELLEASEESTTDHPGTEELVAYHENRLGDSQARRVAEHLDRCLSCAEQLRQLDAFDLEAPESAELRPDPEIMREDWQALRERLHSEQISLGTSSPGEAEREAVWPPIEAVPPERAGTTGVWWLLVAALVVVALAGWWVALRGIVAPHPSEMATARFEERVHPYMDELVADEEGLRRAATAQVVTPPSEADLLILRLLFGELTRHQAFSVEIFDASDQRVWGPNPVIRQPKGSFLILIPRDGLPAGAYRLELEAETAGPENPLATYSFVLHPSG